MERSHRTIEDMIQVTPPDVNWLEILNSILFVFRVFKHSSTKTSPFKILYGHQPKLPIEMDYKIKKGNPVVPSVQAMEEEWEERSCEEKIETMLCIRQQVLVEVAGNIKKAQETQSKYYSRTHNTKPLKIGQMLKRNLKDASRKEKVVKKWSSHPYTIPGISECGNVYVKDMYGVKHTKDLFLMVSLSHTKMLIMYPQMKMWSRMILIKFPPSTVSVIKGFCNQ